MSRLFSILVVALLGAQLAHAERTTTYYHTDSLGSVVAASNQAGALLWRKDYAPFGAQADLIDEKEKMAYTAKEHDDISRFTYFGARYYDPAFGRFLSIDPAGFDPANPLTFNRYAYANNNPYRFVDPDGRDPEQIFGIMMGIVHKKEDALKIQQAELAANNFAAADGIDVGLALAEAKRAFQNGESVNGGSLKGALTAATLAAVGAVVKKKTRTRNVQGGVTDPGEVLGGAEKWLGKGYKEISPGVFRSADGRRQFRMTDSDLTDPKQGPHVHFEAVDADGRTILENSHVLIKE
jgi:RHS repeat-associated protein